MLYCQKSQFNERLSTSLLTLIPANIGVLEGPLLAVSSYPRHHKLRPLNGCFRVDSGTSNQRVGYSCLRPRLCENSAKGIITLSS